MGPRELPFRIVDAFAHERFTGNPAVVVLVAEEVTEAVFARIAGEFNQCETVFVLPAESGSTADLRLRWFTPHGEVGMSGHASLAAVHALIEVGRLPAAQSPDPVPVEIATRGGSLYAFADDQGVVWLDLTDPVLTPLPKVPDDLLGVLRLNRGALVATPPPARTQDGDWLIFVNGVLSLYGMMPDFLGLAAWCQQHHVRGVCVATTQTQDPSLNVQSRFFAPAVGIHEDPVTGSVHGPLAVHLVSCDHVQMMEDLAALLCAQGRAGDRAGLVRVFVQRREQGRYAVRVGGPCITAAAGVIYL